MGSTRLPGKTLRAVLGRPLLSYLLERLQRSKRVNVIVVATTTKSQDDPVAALAKMHGAAVFRGSEEDVLERYNQASQAVAADLVLRVTADCPLLDPRIVDQVIDYFLSNQYDYVSNTLQKTYPRGMDVEMFTQKCLQEVAEIAKLPAEKEHVTLYMYSHPEKYRLGNVAYIKDVSFYRFTVDTEEDFTLVSKILEALYPSSPSFTFEDVLAIMKKHPDWASINANVKQKKV